MNWYSSNLLSEIKYLYKKSQKFFQEYGVWISPDGKIYIVEFENHAKKGLSILKELKGQEYNSQNPTSELLDIGFIAVRTNSDSININCNKQPTKIQLNKLKDYVVSSSFNYYNMESPTINFLNQSMRSCLEYLDGKKKSPNIIR